MVKYFKEFLTHHVNFKNTTNFNKYMYGKFKIINYKGWR